MDILHLFADDEGVSHFRDTTVTLELADFAPPAPPLLLSAAESAERFVLLDLPAGWGGAQHRSPRRQVAF